MPIRTIWKPGAALALLAGSTLHAQPAGYMNNSQLADRLGGIALSELASLSTIGESLNGEPIHLLTLRGSDGPAPALLIVAGIDADHLASTEIATRVGEALLREHAALLGGMTVYIIPRANPDGAAMSMAGLRSNHTGNARPVDEDRDRMTDEDPADDLNGDGIVSVMRRLQPDLDETPSHLADPDDARLSIKPGDGQRAVFTLYPEGIDNDADGEINEDRAGSVDINLNFMHRWPEHNPHAGRHALSEPEALALASFVLAQDDIVGAVTIGRHDNLVNQPDAKKKDITGRAPLEIDAADADLYALAGDWFREATGFSHAPEHDSGGSFHAWLYAQRGLPSFAVNAWSLPGEVGGGASSTEPAQDEDSSGLTPSPVGDISMETLEELREAYTLMTGEEPDESMVGQLTEEMVVQFAAQMGIEVRRVEPAEDKRPAPPPAAKPKKALSDEGKWLAYFEQQGIEGFVEWQPFDHPTLGPVEIGGFVPGARINPPAGLLDELAAGQTAFVVDLIEAQPQIEVLGPQIEEIGAGLFEVTLVIENNGQLPTTTAFSRTNRGIKPTVITLSAPVDRVLQGRRVDRIWGIDGEGGRTLHRWVLRSDDIEQETVTIDDPRYGRRVIRLGSN